MSHQRKKIDLVAMALKELKRPRTILFSIIIGILCGQYSPRATSLLSPLSLIFFSLLKMCALPIVITAVILSFARLWSSGAAMQYLSRIATVFSIAVLTCSLLGSTLSIPISNHLLKDKKTFDTLSKVMKPSSEEVLQNKTAGFTSFLIEMIPKNIFKTLSDGQILGTLLFVILLGIAIGMNKAASLNVLLNTIEGFNEAFFRMIHWFTYLLPFALCSIAAQTFSGLDSNSIDIFGRLFVYTLSALSFLFFMQVNLARLLLGISWKSLYKRMREPALIALSSSSSLATLPSLTISLEQTSTREKSDKEKENGIDRWLLDLILPIGITFCQQASVFFYSFMAVFVAKVYGIPIGPTELVLIGFGSYLQTLTSAGLPAAASIGFLAAVFRPVGIPVDTLGVVLLGLMPLLDPFLTLTNVSGHLLSASATRKLFALSGSKAPKPEAESYQLGLGK